MATRYESLLQWMAEHFVTFVEIGNRLGMSASGARQALCKEVIGQDHHDTLTGLGMPSELLPKRHDVRRGRRKREPVWPGLRDVQTPS